MAAPTNTYTSLTAVGQREDLHDVIRMTDPTECIIYSSMGESKAKGRKHEWLDRTLAAPAANSRVEGDLFAREAANNPARREALCQIAGKTYGVTATMEAIDKAGRESELREQRLIKGIELKRDLELIVSSQQPQREESGGNGRNTRGLCHYMATNVSRGVGGANAASLTAAATDGTQRAFTETLLKAVLATAVTNGVRVGRCKLFLAPLVKQTASGFAGRAAAQEQVKKGYIQGAATMYGSDFGDLELVLSLFHRTRDAIGMDPEHAKIAWLRRMQRSTLPNDSDGQGEAVVCEFATEVHEKAHFGVFDLS
jgi:hypothetical protein